MAVDPFVVAATRVLKPLIADLHQAVASQHGWESAELAEIRAQVERLEAGLREDRARLSLLRTAVAAGLSAIAAILLNIVSSRLDASLPWEALWHEVREARRRLGL